MAHWPSAMPYPHSRGYTKPNVHRDGQVAQTNQPPEQLVIRQAKTPGSKMFLLKEADTSQLQQVIIVCECVARFFHF